MLTGFEAARTLIGARGAFHILRNTYTHMDDLHEHLQGNEPPHDDDNEDLVTPNVCGGTILNQDSNDQNTILTRTGIEVGSSCQDLYMRSQNIDFSNNPTEITPDSICNLISGCTLYNTPEGIEQYNQEQAQRTLLINNQL